MKITLYEWERVLMSTRLSSTDKLVAFVMRTFANADGTRVHPSSATIARLASLGTTSAKNSRARLRNVGFFRKIGGHSSTHHECSLPSEQGLKRLLRHDGELVQEFGREEVVNDFARALYDLMDEALALTTDDREGAYALFARLGEQMGFMGQGAPSSLILPPSLEVDTSCPPGGQQASPVEVEAPQPQGSNTGADALTLALMEQLKALTAEVREMKQGVQQVYPGGTPGVPNQTLNQTRPHTSIHPSSGLTEIYARTHEAHSVPGARWSNEVEQGSHPGSTERPLDPGGMDGRWDLDQHTHDPGPEDQDDDEGYDDDYSDDQGYDDDATDHATQARLESIYSAAIPGWGSSPYGDSSTHQRASYDDEDGYPSDEESDEDDDGIDYPTWDNRRHLGQRGTLEDTMRELEELERQDREEEARRRAATRQPMPTLASMRRSIEDTAATSAGSAGRDGWTEGSGHEDTTTAPLLHAAATATATTTRQPQGNEAAILSRIVASGIQCTHDDPYALLKAMNAAGYPHRGLERRDRFPKPRVPAAPTPSQPSPARAVCGGAEAAGEGAPGEATSALRATQPPSAPLDPSIHPATHPPTVQGQATYEPIKAPRSPQKPRVSMDLYLAALKGEDAPERPLSARERALAQMEENRKARREAEEATRQGASAAIDFDAILAARERARQQENARRAAAGLPSVEEEIAEQERKEQEAAERARAEHIAAVKASMSPEGWDDAEPVRLDKFPPPPAFPATKAERIDPRHFAAAVAESDLSPPGWKVEDARDKRMCLYLAYWWRKDCLLWALERAQERVKGTSRSPLGLVASIASSETQIIDPDRPGREWFPPELRYVTPPATYTPPPPPEPPTPEEVRSGRMVEIAVCAWVAGIFTLPDCFDPTYAGVREWARQSAAQRQPFELAWWDEWMEEQIAALHEQGITDITEAHARIFRAALKAKEAF